MPALLPDTDNNTQWFGDRYAGSVIDPNKGVLHTTEGTGWPGYEYGGTAPHLTLKPDFANKKLRRRQHFSFYRSARALRNLAGGVETNTQDVIQIELIGTCAPGTRNEWVRDGLVQDRDFIFWPEAPDWALRELAEVIRWFAKENMIKAASPIAGRWTPYPESYGYGGQRLSGSQWLAVRGWVGHQHVPENDHGDPGALRFGRVLDFVAEITAQEWFEMATKAELKDALAEVLTVDNAAFMNALRVAIEAERAEDAAAVWEHELEHPNGTKAKAKGWLMYGNTKIDDLKVWLQGKLGQ